MCDTPEYVDRSVGSIVYRFTVILSNVCDTLEYVDRRQVMVHLYIESQPGCSMCVCDTLEYVDRSIGSFVYRDSARMSHVCYTHEYEDRSLGSSVYRITVRLSHVCDTTEYEDIRQVLVNLYINS